MITTADKAELDRMMAPQAFRACAWCRQWFDLEWRPIADPQDKPEFISHGICPECLERERRALEATRNTFYSPHTADRERRPL